MSVPGPDRVLCYLDRRWRTVDNVAARSGLVTIDVHYQLWELIQRGVVEMRMGNARKYLATYRLVGGKQDSTQSAESEEG